MPAGLRLLTPANVSRPPLITTFIGSILFHGGGESIRLSKSPSTSRSPGSPTAPSFLSRETVASEIAKTPSFSQSLVFSTVPSFLTKDAIAPGHYGYNCFSVQAFQRSDHTSSFKMNVIKNNLNTQLCVQMISNHTYFLNDKVRQICFYYDHSCVADCILEVF